jgi:4-hydroxy-tetrahydrodipicolinate synthase
MTAPVSGVFAAVATPVNNNGEVNYGAFEQGVDLVLKAGVDGICVGGATGEYIRFNVNQRKDLFTRSAELVSGKAKFLAAVGGPTIREVVDLGNHAAQCGADTLLLPMPYFFVYEQDDLEPFAREASRALPVPCLLYNLPAFTNGLQPETIIRLISGEPNIVGVKDSSGQAAHLTQLLKLRDGGPASLLVGHDKLLGLAYQAGWDGVISGVAAFCPELIVGFAASFHAGREEDVARLERQRMDLIAQLEKLPTPWAVRLGLEVRGINPGPYPIPASDRRREQMREFQQWFETFLAGLGAG